MQFGVRMTSENPVADQLECIAATDTLAALGHIEARLYRLWRASPDHAATLLAALHAKRREIIDGSLSPNRGNAA